MLHQLRPDRDRAGEGGFFHLGKIMAKRGTVSTVLFSFSQRRNSPVANPG